MALWATNLWATDLWASNLWEGLTTNPTPVTREDPGDPTGGFESFGGDNAYSSRQQRKKDREERLKRIRQELRNMNRWR